MTSTDCVQRMVQWISRVNEGANTTLLAGIATLGLVISSGMVAPRQRPSCAPSSCASQIQSEGFCQHLVASCWA